MKGDGKGGEAGRADGTRALRAGAVQKDEKDGRRARGEAGKEDDFTDAGQIYGLHASTE